MLKQNIFLISLVIALSGLLFGYDTGIISGAMLFIKQTFPLSDTQVGIIVSAVPVGALIGSAVSGKLCDWIGRKTALLITAALFVVGAAFCCLSLSIETLIAGRALLGLAVGIGSATSPLYTSELAEENRRGMLVNLFVVAIQSGIFLSFVVGYLLSSSGNWRVMIGLGILPAVLLGATAVLLPESPRWLVLKGQSARARKILSQLYGDTKAESELINIKSVASTDESDWSLLLSPAFLKILFVGIAVSVFTQTIGINAINYYAPTIFQTTGFATPEMATFATMFIGLVLVLSTISSLFFIDKIGRRKPLLLGMLGILVALAVITLTFTFCQHPSTLAWTMLLSSIAFMVFHGVSIGPACFLIPSEIFPVRVRGLAMGISVACNWGANVLVALLFPIGLTHLGVSGVFAIFLAVSVVGWICFYLWVPETKGLPLEQIEKELKAGQAIRHLGKQSPQTAGVDRCQAA